VAGCNNYHSEQGDYATATGTELRALLGDGWTVDGNSNVVPATATLGTKCINIADGIEHGTLTCPSTSVPGTAVTLTFTPNEYYVVTSATYNDGTNHAITPQNGIYRFTMPDHDVTVSATFGLDPAAIGYVAYNAEANMYESLLRLSPTAVGNNTTTLGSTGNETWYVVNGNVAVSNRMEVQGTVNLILADGSMLAAQRGITVHSGNTLVIYGQEDGTGKLIATGTQVNGSGSEAAAIGTVESNTGGTIIVHGGNVSATGYEWTAGIGGGVRGGGCTTIFYGGTTHAKTAAANYGDSEAIGHGSSGIGSGSKTIIDGLRVRVGSSATPVASGSRVGSLSNKTEVTIEPCTTGTATTAPTAACSTTIP
jgi:hypothetical protein